MDDRSSLSAASPDVMRHGRWKYLLPLIWLGLGARIVVALARGESLRNDFLSLAVLAFFMTTSLLGSRLWLWRHDHLDRVTQRHIHRDRTN